MPPHPTPSPALAARLKEVAQAAAARAGPRPIERTGPREEREKREGGGVTGFTNLRARPRKGLVGELGRPRKILTIQEMSIARRLIKREDDPGCLKEINAYFAAVEKSGHGSPQVKIIETALQLCMERAVGGRAGISCCPAVCSVPCV
jgi:hypothetical protein